MSNLLQNASLWIDQFSNSPPACWNGSEYVAVNSSVVLTLSNAYAPMSGDLLYAYFTSVNGNSQVSLYANGSPVTDILGNQLYTTPAGTTQDTWNVPAGQSPYVFTINAGEGCGSDTVTISFPEEPKQGVILRWSDDGGHNWSNPSYASQGDKGQMAQRVIWRRIGSTRRNSGLDRIFEVSSDDPVQVALVGASIGDG